VVISIVKKIVVAACMLGPMCDAAAGSMSTIDPESDRNLKFSLEDADFPGRGVSTDTRNLIIRIGGSSLVVEGDTIWVDIKSTGHSGDDSLARVPLIAGPKEPIAFASARIPFKMGPGTMDDTLSYFPESLLEIRYVDAVYGTLTVFTVDIGGLSVKTIAGAWNQGLWSRSGLMGGGFLDARPPQAIACFDAMGIFRGWAKPTGTAGIWRTPMVKGTMALDIRFSDGRRKFLKVTSEVR
jgi:hypothetical protein